jgi:hypothetical protein
MVACIKAVLTAKTRRRSGTVQRQWISIPCSWTERHLRCLQQCCATYCEPRHPHPDDKSAGCAGLPRRYSYHPRQRDECQFCQRFDMSVSFDPTVHNWWDHRTCILTLPMACSSCSRVPATYRCSGTQLRCLHGDATLAELVFHYTGGSSNLNWAAGSST